MPWTKRVNPASISLLALACLFGVQVLAAQQAASGAASEGSRISAASGHATSTSAQTGMGHVTSTGGGSSWGAGKGSFGYGVQPGGVWRDGGTLSSLPASNKSPTEGLPSAASASLGRSGLAHPSGMRQATALSGRSAGPKMAGLKFGAAGSRGGLASRRRGSQGAKRGAHQLGAGGAAQRGHSLGSPASPRRITGSPSPLSSGYRAKPRSSGMGLR